jgi:hypothetical protein
MAVGKHAFTVAFESHAQRDEFLELWVNAAPAQAVSASLLKQYGKLEKASTMMRWRVATAVGAGAVMAEAADEFAPAPDDATLSANAGHRRRSVDDASTGRVQSGHLPSVPAPSPVDETDTANASEMSRLVSTQPKAMVATPGAPSTDLVELVRRSPAPLATPPPLPQPPPSPPATL